MNKIPNGWKEKKLKYIAEITSSKRIYEYEYVDSGIPFYRGKEITALKNNQKIENFIYISEKRYNELKEKYGVPSKYDILITAVGTVGNAYTIEDDKPFYFKDGNLLWLKNIKEYPKFVEYLFECNKNILLNNFFGSVQHALTISRLENLTFYFPPLDEQKRIASALSKIDAYLENTIKLIEEKERFKRGIAKKLLTCKEGENIPEARFKGFEDEWKETQILEFVNNNIIKIEKGKSITKSKIEEGDIPVIAGGKTPPYYHNKYNYNFPCITISASGSAGYVWFHDYKIWASDCHVIYTDNKRYNIKFLYHYLKNIQDLIYYLQVGGVQKHVYAKDLIKLNIPNITIEEQEKIGGYLSLLDEEIDNLKKQKELIKEMKRGAMQKLLSGEVRLLE
ncbi:restriction endonuclease subunit S [Brachyspira aalborgi]|uniref:Restriction endonuclease subunit S n=2 Tax=Brachyspira TaxID=29521 RepID=A0AB38Q2J3_9SPIR|nr:restriction endonuclease subunit S [Brachyspira aalborgi]TXJ16773.1 restriction endonuclease subunit S [Brachyspira aalborgi]TXJ22175.1 restriction endonuclease subunit S [Brachyspira aalborgi]TXJ28135.1 restriction endonuclease subunit S [Brachyspira aalborgi]TXJ50973.1 restriction endonuclease subunit S [Brachyspira aalborgi]